MMQNGQNFRQKVTPFKLLTCLFLCLVLILPMMSNVKVTYKIGSRNVPFTVDLNKSVTVND